MSAKGTDDEPALADRIAELEAAESVGRGDLIDFLAELPEASSVEHRRTVEALVRRVPGAAEACRSILADEGLAIGHGEADRVRLGAFLAAHVRYRRRGDVEALEALHDEFGDRFADRPAYDAARADLLEARGRPGDLRRAIDLREAVLETLGDDPDRRAALAGTILRALDEGAVPDADRERRQRRAREAIDAAIDGRPDRGEYHVTKGRLLAREGEYDRARARIERGIDLVDPSAGDHALRVARFRRRLLAVDVREHERRLTGRIDGLDERIGDLDERIEGLDERIDDAEERAGEVVADVQGTALQFLGFFAAVLAAVLLTVQVAVQYPPGEAAGLLVVVFGGLTAALGAFSLLVPGQESVRRALGVAGAGLAVLLVGVAVAVLA